MCICIYIYIYIPLRQSAPGSTQIVPGVHIIEAMRHRVSRGN